MIETPDTPKKSRRGFAGMSVEKRTEIAKRGGARVPHSKRSFSADKELARESGRKGGKGVPADRRSFATNRTLARKAGQKGGLATRAKMQQKLKEESDVRS